VVAAGEEVLVALGNGEIGIGEADAGVRPFGRGGEIVDQGLGLLVAHVEARHAQPGHRPKLDGIAQELE